MREFFDASVLNAPLGLEEADLAGLMFRELRAQLLKNRSRLFDPSVGFLKLVATQAL
jgi:hypothetical protein